MNISIRAGMAPLGPVHVRLSGVVRGDDKGPGIGIVNAPTAAEATAELHRVARVSGADRVVSVASDYRRAALAGGTASTQWRIEVQAWGTALAPAKPEPSEQPEEKRDAEADEAKDRSAVKKADDARTDAQGEASRAKAEDAAPPEAAAVPRAEAVSEAPAPQASADSAPVPASAPAAVPASPPPSDR